MKLIFKIYVNVEMFICMLGFIVEVIVMFFM